jgi:ribonuclease D
MLTLKDTADAVNSLYIDTPAGLLDLVTRLEEAPEIALDTEADSLHHYFEKVCLIQLSAGEENAIVDPLCGMDLSPLLALLAHRPLLLHGADYDLRMMRMTFGFLPEGEVFDTMLAARLLGYEEFGLAALVGRFFEVRLSKGGQKSDWSRRPLSESQLRYAGDDTRYLLPLAARLREELEKLGRIEWHRETCQSMVIQASRESDKDQNERWRIKGSFQLTPGQLNFLRALFQWRDLEARGVDRPPFHILGNQQLLDLAVRADSDPDGAFRAGPKLPRNCKGRRLQALKKAITEAAERPESEWPENKRRERPPSAPTGLLKTLRAECDRLAEELGIPSSTLAPRPALVNIARIKPVTLEGIMECGPLMGWQARLLEPGIRKLVKK